MKKFTNSLLIGAFGMSFLLFGFDKTVTLSPSTNLYSINLIDTTIYTKVDTLPNFKGGLKAFGSFLAQNLKYPKVAKDNKIEGRVFARFVVEKDGKLSQIKIVRGIGGGCDEETMRVLKLSPKWNPGTNKGKQVRVQYTVPVLFSLDK